ncbi:hypothetical protein HYDPIDRAFT_28302 [Hydnomerulius pinastri MD-312]|uniref:DUF6534 domain-containing protein n=1 Tax=Hydnomerulius pinastri MD-312 TaxID=994086 RepID=A0A0C9W1Y3_9AGAM|nr:hypothetical protein HYDPIDRAFT_28302 [Hydnomerulius pinastri MD-312]
MLPTTADVLNVSIPGLSDVNDLEYVNLYLSLGPMEVGIVVASILLGCAIVQTFIYYQKFPNDNRGLRCLVGFEISLGITHLVCAVSSMWRATITEYGELGSLILLPNPSFAAVILSAPITFCVEVFFIHRLYKLSQGLILPTLCIALALVQLGFTMTLGIAGFYASNLLLYEAQWDWLITSILFVSPTCDVAITAGLCYQMYKMRKNGFDRANLDAVISETGLVISLAGIVEAFCPWMMPHNFAYCFKFCLVIFPVESGLYMNCLLAALNCRAAYSETRKLERVAEFGELGSGRSDSTNNTLTGAGHWRGMREV